MLGGGWRPRLAVWAIPAAAAAVLWVPAVLRRDVPLPGRGSSVHSALPLLRKPLAWKVILLLALIGPQLLFGLGAGRGELSAAEAPAGS